MYPTAATLVDWYRPPWRGRSRLGLLACAALAYRRLLRSRAVFQGLPCRLPILPGFVARLDGRADDLPCHRRCLGIHAPPLSGGRGSHAPAGCRGVSARSRLASRICIPGRCPRQRPTTAILAGQSIYLNEPFFFGRAIGYFAIWLLLGLGLTRWSVRRIGPRTRTRPTGSTASAASGLLLYGVTLHFAAVDWLMTLQPEFHSTIFGPVVVAGQIVSAYALAVVAICLLGARPPLANFIGPKLLNDMGNLLLSFVVVWSYLCWFQYLLSWIANLPYDAVWYVPRLRNGWQWLALALVVFHFAVPVLVLLFRSAKQNRVVLGSVAALLLVMQLAFSYYQVAPPFEAFGLAQHWMALVAPIALGGIWLAYYLWRLGSYPVLAEYDYNENKRPACARATSMRRPGRRFFPWLRSIFRRTRTRQATPPRPTAERARRTSGGSPRKFRRAFSLGPGVHCHLDPGWRRPVGLVWMLFQAGERQR